MRRWDIKDRDFKDFGPMQAARYTQFGLGCHLILGLSSTGRTASGLAPSTLWVLPSCPQSHCPQKPQMRTMLCCSICNLSCLLQKYWCKKLCCVFSYHFRQFKLNSYPRLWMYTHSIVTEATHGTHRRSRSAAPQIWLRPQGWSWAAWSWATLHTCPGGQRWFSGTDASISVEAAKVLM